MATLSPPRAALRTPSHQFALPRASSPVTRPVALPTAEAEIAAHQVWSSLSPALPAHLHHTARRILQEVVRDAGRR
jgi:hypothetical protein